MSADDGNPSDLPNGSRKRKAKDRDEAEGLRKQKRVWVKKRSKTWWEQRNGPDFPEDEFKKEFRMGKATFDMICNELTTSIEKNDKRRKDAVPVRKRVAVCIWRLATGEKLKDVAEKFGLGTSTIHKIIREVCEALETVLKDKYLKWPEVESAKMIQDGYESLSGIPKLIGSMYTTDIPIIAPTKDPSKYRHENEMTCYSVRVQGVVNHKGVFTDVFIGSPGLMSDDQVLKESVQKESDLAETVKGLRGVLIGAGCGYTLSDGVVVPYAKPKRWTHSDFNMRLGKVEKVSKDAFARLKGRWCCLERLDVKVIKDVPNIIILACCILHNICELMNEEMDTTKCEFDDLYDDRIAEPVKPIGSSTAKEARDSLADYLFHFVKGPACKLEGNLNTA
ncbi:OLC1v1001388C1 [Oldenlandia corymbosa var. corymbosa]|uniref:OLC1v1001388C1 n=1 Tax=Oldenlandia corymbosa var. corymbosa TaxID=529605 RepID=A0AAV1D5D4_OLDCO|nr:OLC1v1001388C1 [Oldenlandia corymbosa var. corymbosa]